MNCVVYEGFLTRRALTCAPLCIPPIESLHFKGSYKFRGIQAVRALGRKGAALFVRVYQRGERGHVQKYPLIYITLLYVILRPPSV